MTQFIILFVLLIIFSAFIINGFYSITRGRWEKNADGSLFWTGKILKGYHKWLQTHILKLVPFENDEFLKNFFQLKSYFGDNDILSMDKNFVIVKRMSEIRTAMFFAFAASKGLDVGVKEIGETVVKNHLIAIYKPVKEYKLPEWVRDPMGECINCMASIFGTILFTFWSLITYHVNEIHPTVAGNVFVDLAVGFKIMLWILFCITLAHLNEYIFNLNAALKKNAGK